MEFSIPYNIPSQNTRDGWHWVAKHKDTKRCEGMVRMQSRGIPKATGKRFVFVTSYRVQRFKDDANFRGGAKGLLDALTRAGLLLDDDDHNAAISYEQFTLSMMPPDLDRLFGGRPCTAVRLEDA